jgi:hypothetical protein
MTRKARGGDGVLDRAKRLQGELVRLGERRSRQVERVEGAFRLDLLAAIHGEPDWLVDLVHRALEAEPTQQALVTDLVHAMAETRERLVRASEAVRMTGAARPLVDGIDFGNPPGALAPLVLDAPVAESVEHSATLHESLRYPEPGEPARMLDDGTIVAIDDESAEAD